MQGWYTLFPDGDDDTVMGKILLVITQVPNQKTEPEFRFDKLPHTNDLNIWIGTFNCGNLFFCFWSKNKNPAFLETKN